MTRCQSIPLILMLSCLFVASKSAADLVENPLLNLRHPEGFFIKQFATDEQVHDVRTIALNAKNQLYASSRGWIRRLGDADGDGEVDDVALFTETLTGASGMVFVGNDLYAIADGYFCRYLDSNADGIADGPPQRFFEFDSGPGGAHSLRRGPDGSWYIMAGPHTRLRNQHWNHPGSPIRSPEAGSLIHISADLSRSEVLAEGFYNATDFDFHFSGGVFTPDSALTQDQLMPWHALPRLFHVAHGAHHGWRQPGPFRPWSKPDYYPDHVPVNWSLNGNIGAGIEFYRHHQFPKEYRDGALVCDWENGRILHVQPRIFQSSYTSTVNTFVESTGNIGFTPIDLVVEDDGSLLVASGGRGTAGGIYRIKYLQLDPETGKLPDQPPPYLSNLDAALRPPQRLEIWSRANWMPLAFREGRRAFEGVAMSLNDPEEYKLVAVDVLTEMFGGLNQAVARMTSKSAFASVRARTAWSLSRYPFYGYLVVLNELSVDESPFVRRAALDTIFDHRSNIPASEMLRTSSQNLGHEDSRVREGAIAVAAALPDMQWQLLTNRLDKAPSLHRLSVALALIERAGSDTINEFAIDEALRVLGDPEKGTPLLGMVASRVLMRSFGDWNLARTTTEAFAPFELSLASPFTSDRSMQIVDTIRRIFPTGGVPLLDAELARLLAMFGDPDPDTVLRMLRAFSVQSPASSDIHYLAAIAQLNPASTPGAVTNLAEVLLWLDNKVGTARELPEQDWKPRVVEVATRLIEKYPIVGSSLMGHREFVRPEHAFLAQALLPVQQPVARQIYLSAIQSQPNFSWTPGLVELMADERSAQVFGWLRGLWGVAGLREAIVRGLSKQPDVLDRDKFIAALNSSEPETVVAAATALTEIAETNYQQVIGPMIAALYRASTRPAQVEVRLRIVGWLKKHGGLPADVLETDTDLRSLEIAYTPVFAWFENAHKVIAVTLSGMQEDSFDFWQEQIRSVPWTRGKVDKGRKLFADHQCANCHAGGTGIGPDLLGVSERHTPTGLIRTIIYPHLNVTENYSVCNITTKGGEHYSGVIVFESPNTILLQTEKGETVRLRHTEVKQRVATHQTTMPIGLMKRTNARDLADLYAYLKTLN